MAETSTEPALQETLNEIGRHWMLLADQLEAARRLLDEKSNGNAVVGASSVAEFPPPTD